MTDQTYDQEFDAMLAKLERRERALSRYLKIRGNVGLVLAAIGVGFAVFAVIVVLHALGALTVEPLIGWTSGFTLVLALFIPVAPATIAIRAGLGWWRERRPADRDEGGLNRTDGDELAGSRGARGEDLKRDLSR